MSEQANKSIFTATSKDTFEFWKILLLAACFFLVFAGYTIIRELKDLVFLSIVGLDSFNYAKILSTAVLVPFVFLYSRLVDLLRRHQLICFYLTLYGLGGIVCVYFLGHETIGLANTHQDPSRLFGWVFYFFFEGYQPFVASLLWAFLNSIMKSSEVSNGYVVVTASSKLGGVLTAGLAWFFLQTQDSPTALFSYVTSYQLLLFIASVLLLCVPPVIIYFMRVIPPAHLHGYEAVYQLEKKAARQRKKGGLRETVSSMIAGLSLLIRYPYALGIFGMIFFWEIINVIFNFIRLSIGQASSHSACEFGAYLYQQVCFMNLVSFAIVLLGTRFFIKLFGERRSLIAIPILIGVVISYYLAVQTTVAATVCYVIMRALNYAFAYPLRESLYIPTTKAIKFKTKSWIDGFGAKFSKTFGSFYNIIVSNVAASALFSVHTFFFAGIIGIWVLVAHKLGKRFEEAIGKDEVIGVEEA